MYKIKFNGKMYDLVDGRKTNYWGDEVDNIIVTGSKELCEMVRGKNSIHPSRFWSPNNDTPATQSDSNTTENGGSEPVKSTTQTEFDKWLDEVNNGGIEETETDDVLGEGKDSSEEKTEEYDPYKWHHTNYGDTYGNGELHCYFNDFETIWKIIGEDGQVYPICKITENRKQYGI